MGHMMMSVAWQISLLESNIQPIKLGVKLVLQPATVKVPSGNIVKAQTDATLSFSTAQHGHNFLFCGAALSYKVVAEHLRLQHLF